jgi:hypothetical protein
MLQMNLILFYLISTTFYFGYLCGKHEEDIDCESSPIARMVWVLSLAFLSYILWWVLIIGWLISWKEEKRSKARSRYIEKNSDF